MLVYSPMSLTSIIILTVHRLTLFNRRHPRPFVKRRDSIECRGEEKISHRPFRHLIDLLALLDVSLRPARLAAVATGGTYWSKRRHENGRCGIRRGMAICGYRAERTYIRPARKMTVVRAISDER